MISFTHTSHTDDTHTYEHSEDRNYVQSERLISPLHGRGCRPKSAPLQTQGPTTRDGQTRPQGGQT